MTQHEEATADVRVARQDGVVTITLDRAHRKNAITETMWGTLAATAREIAANADDRVVIFTGANGEFSSGADLASGGKGAVETPLTQMRAVNDACLAIHAIPQPTIAKVDGIAAGAGLNLALACDLIVATSRARFSEIFTKRGLSVDFGGSWVLPRLVGMAKAKELVFLADIIDAAEAERIGLVNRVLDPEEIDGFVDDWATRLASLPPIALSQSKRLLSDSFDNTLAQALTGEAAAQTVNFRTEDTAEAIRAFLKKRPPVFRGR